MKIQIFGSSSAGNCIRIFTDDCPGVYLDAGVNPAILMAAGAPIANMPFFITHEHGDHAKYVDDLKHRFGAKVYATMDTAMAIAVKNPYKYSVYGITPGFFCMPNEDCLVWPLRVIHYPAADPVCYVVEIGEERILYLVDCGQLPDQDSIPDCDYYFIEANYTPAALARNDNQWIGVRARVQSGFGHLSVLDAYEFLKPRMSHARKIILGHISSNNFDLQEYERIIPADFRDRAILASAGMLIDTDPF
jgi:phosphoribosyl 1,2-cyclic phosphodiesterase